MSQDQEVTERINDFNSELSFELRTRFRLLATRLNGNGKPTAQQLTDCALGCAAEIQRHGSDFLEEYQFMNLMGSLREHPEYGESLRPFYDASCNGKK